MEPRSILDDLNDFAKANEEYRDEKRKQAFNKRRKIWLSVLFPLAIVILLVVVPIYNSLKLAYYSGNVYYKLQSMYKGKFEITNPKQDYKKMRTTPDGLYEVRAKNKIEFKAVQSVAYGVTTDYEDYILKNIVLEYIKKHPNNHVFYEELQKNDNSKMFIFKFGINIDDLNEIDKAIDEMYDLRKFIIKKSKKYFKDKSQFYIYFKHNEYEKAVHSLYTNQSKDYFAGEIKYAFANLGIENSGNLEEYKKPKELSVYVNGNLINYDANNTKYLAKATYDAMRKDYYINMGRLEEALKDICIYNRGVLNNIESLTYNGRVYKFVPSIETNYEITKDKVPYEWSMTQIENFFGAKVGFDYEREEVHIEV